jgi:hypothetical protein
MTARSWLRTLFAPRTVRQGLARPPVRRRLRLEVEPLEERAVPTITYHGGPLLTHVDVQAMYLGSDWSTPAYQPQVAYFDGFLNDLVHGSFMKTLNKAGYGVDTGTFSAGVIDPLSLTQGDPTACLSARAIEARLHSAINNGTLNAPNANSLYVVFVEDDVPVAFHPGNSTSINAFAGYHSVFRDNGRGNNSTDVYYAVVTYPGGTVGNGWGVYSPWLFNTAVGRTQEMTIAASHEVAEAATDPAFGYTAAPGWWDDTFGGGGEVGDISAWQATYLHGYAVQRISDVHDQAMTPAGASSLPGRALSFVLQADGLHEVVNGALVSTPIATGVASISDQSVDLDGRVMIDYVDTSGNAFSFHDDGSSPEKIWDASAQGVGVTQAVADQGAHYLLLANGQLWQAKYNTYLVFQNQNPWVWSKKADNVRSISAGTDQFGVTSVDYVTTSGAAAEYSDATGFHSLEASGVSAVSAGQQGASALLLATGEADFYDEATGSTTILAASGVMQVTVGTDANGNALVERLDTTGTLYEYQNGPSASPTQIQSGVQSISKARADVVDALLTSGAFTEHDDGTNTWTGPITSGFLALG